MKYSLDYFLKFASSSNESASIPIIAITCPYEKDTIDSLVELAELKMVKAILVGEKSKIDKIHYSGKFDVVDAKDDLDAAIKTMQLLKDKKADILMKGQIDTSLLLKTLLQKEYDLRTNRIMNHICLSFNENYDKYYLITDAAMIIKPTLEQKQKMIENTVRFAKALGIKMPKVACLCAKEKPYDKMPETLDAKILQEKNLNGEIDGCIVSGPLQIDLAIDKMSAHIKNINDPVAGDADILLCPDIASANILTKGLCYLGDWSFTGVIVGAKIPIVLTSRSTCKRDRQVSIALACIMSNYEKSI